MAELTATEKLQPCLLDRLADDDPKAKEESRAQRVISLQRYRAGVLRDLMWLFNSSAHLAEAGSNKLRLSDYPEAARSVINYGTRQLCGLIAPDMEELEVQLTQAIRIFEPRIIRHTFSINADIDRHLVSFELKGELWANPIPEQLFIKTRIDIESGQCQMGDSVNG